MSFELTAQKQVSSNKTLLVASSYWSFGLGFGSLIPLVEAWVFRKDRFLAHQLIQSALFQGFFSLITLGIFALFLLAGQKGSYTMPSAENLTLVILQGVVSWSVRIVLFIISLMVWRKGSIFLLFFNWLTEKILFLFEKKTLKKAVLLTILWPGFGQLFLGKAWLGWILVASQLVSVLSFLHIYFAYFYFSATKDLLAVFGFYWRVGDQAFAEQVATTNNLIVFASFILLNYIIAFINLPLWYRPRLAQRQIFGSVGVSFLVHIAIFWIILLMPFVFVKSSLDQSVNERAQEIFQRLKKEKEDKLKKKIPPKPSQEREINFDLEITDQVKGVNEFSSKPFSQKIISDKEVQPPTVGFGERKQPLPPRRKYIEQQTRNTKSFSEYVTSKIREGQRDQLIWDKAPNPYSSVIQYTINPDGHISDIRIVESSGNLKADALVISVVESMNPVLKPPNGKQLKITELFWNTGGMRGLNTELKRSLATYPDGRVIE